MDDSALDYEALAQEYTDDLDSNLRARLEKVQEEDEKGRRVDSLRHAILNNVVKENYERARKELNTYVDLKPEYPNFQIKAERYVKHCMDLIQAVETKRHFPGMSSLSMSKQQEIHDRVVAHFNELKQHLVQIEKIEREQKLEDVRSTVWVLKALCHSVGVILAVAFIMDLSTGMLRSSDIVFSAFINDLTDSIMKFFNL